MPIRRSKNRAEQYWRQRDFLGFRQPKEEVGDGFGIVRWLSHELLPEARIDRVSL